ncbi:MAG: YchJ family protein [Endozoicomonas sp.]
MTSLAADSLCPCGSQETLKTCCSLYMENGNAPTAEALMRSRYTAYTMQNISYLIKTTHPEQQSTLKANHVYEQSKKILWQKLEVVNTSAGQSSDTTGTVEFKAWFKEGVSDAMNFHQERSSFIKIVNRWYYIYPNLPFQNAKVPRRNAPCPCGSNKKYKKCCQ